MYLFSPLSLLSSPPFVSPRAWPPKVIALGFPVFQVLPEFTRLLQGKISMKVNCCRNIWFRSTDRRGRPVTSCCRCMSDSRSLFRSALPFKCWLCGKYQAKVRANWSLSWLLKKKPRHSWRQWPVCLQWGAFMKGYWHISFLEPQREPLRALGVGYLKTESTTTTPPLPRRGCRSSKSSDLRDLSCFITCAILSSPSVQQIETEVLCGGVCVCVCAYAERALFCVPLAAQQYWAGG